MTLAKQTIQSHYGSVGMNSSLVSVFEVLQDSGLIASGLLREPTREEYKVIKSIPQAIGDAAVFRDTASVRDMPTCLALMCRHMGVQVQSHVTMPADLTPDDLIALRGSTVSKIGYTMYSTDDPRNHVVPIKAEKSATVSFTVDGGSGNDDCVHGITAPQEFFNPGGRFFRTKFYADDMSGSGFGADSSRKTPIVTMPAGPRSIPLPPESVSGDDIESGGANVTKGVVRPRKRVIRSVADYDRSSAKLRNYTVAGATMFNNVAEMFMNVVSREYAQEIIEHLFNTWGVPSEEPEAMRFAEDILFAFVVARTASNKADYNVAYDLPTRSGPVEADFSKLSTLLADHYGITRRNFSRAIADDIRDYLRRPENQPIKSRAAARIGADPQYGHLCFDGSTECSNLTTSEQKFTRVLEARNLYESDAVLADGASSTLMEGIHGGTRSNVSR